MQVAQITENILWSPLENMKNVIIYISSFYSKYSLGTDSFFVLS